MIVGVISDLVGYLLIPAIILYYLHYPLFKRYVLTIAGYFFGLIRILPIILRGGLKAIATILFLAGLIVIYLVTTIVPFVGERIQNAMSGIEDSFYISSLTFHTRKFRGIMVRIVAENRERELEYSDEEPYRNELSEVKENAKSRLDSGETFLSMTLGIILLVTNAYGIDIFQLGVFGYSISLFIEAWLMAIAISIIYRVSILELLTYSPDDQFASMEELDAALSYQKGVALFDLIQGLAFVLIFLANISNVEYEVIKPVLRKKYGENLPITSWLPLAWQELQNQNAEK